MSRIMVDPAALSIPQIIETLKHWFPESEINEVQRILMDRETKMKTEIENLQKGYVSAKKGAELLEMSQKAAEADKLDLDKEIALLRRERDALKRQKVEADENFENFKIRFEARMMKMEGALADIFNVEVEDLAALANSIDESDDDDEGDVNSETWFTLLQKIIVQIRLVLLVVHNREEVTLVLSHKFQVIETWFTLLQMLLELLLYDLVEDLLVWNHKFQISLRYVMQMMKQTAIL